MTKHFRRPYVIEMGEGAATALGPALRRELVAVGASFPVVGDHSTVRFVVSERFVVSGEAGWKVEDTGMELRVPLERVGDVAALFDGRSGWLNVDLWPGLWFRVVH